MGIYGKLLVIEFWREVTTVGFHYLLSFQCKICHYYVWFMKYSRIQLSLIHKMLLVNVHEIYNTFNL